MAHNGNLSNGIRGGLSPEQRQQLDRLEKRQGAPTDLQRGELNAIRLCANGNDRQRADELAGTWRAAS
jgi:hypothetical protein